MAGKRVVVVDRRTFTFTNLQGSQSQSIVLERALDVTGYKEVTVQVVVHSQTYASTQTLTVTATSVELVDSEPQTDYLALTAAATATFTTGTNGKQIPAACSANFGSHLQLAINAAQPAAPAALACTITVIVTMKE